MSLAPGVRLPRDDETLSWDWPDLVIVITLCLGVVVALGWYWTTGPARGSDMPMALYRVLELDRSVQGRLFFPRWAMDLNYTYGAPLFQYYPPLVSYIVLAFRWVGLTWIGAAKAAITVILFLASLGMYVYARWLFARRSAALVSAIAFLFAPYLLIDVYERGAIAEVLALALLPWLFWTTHQTLETADRVWPWLSCFLVALLVLAHNITALFVLPLLLLFLLLLAWRKKTWRRMLIVLLSFGFGLGLSAFYWLPAVAERDYAQIAFRMLEGHYRADVHLRPLAGLVQHQLVFDYSGALRFSLSLWQAILMVIAALALATQPSALRYRLILLVGMVGGILLLQLDTSRAFWQAVPLARYIQFPWRLLGIAAVSIALLAGSLLAGSRPSGASRWLAAGAIIVFILYGSTSALKPNFTPDNPQLLSAEISLEGAYERGRTTFAPFSDFLPASVRVNPWELTESRPVGSTRLLPVTYTPALTVTRDAPNSLTLDIHADEPFALRFHRFFFPGWQVYAAGRPISTYPSGDLGLVTADLPAGIYPVTVQFDQTPLRRRADAISIISFLIWITVGGVTHRARPVLAGLGAVLGLTAILLLTTHGMGAPPRHPTPYAVNFQDQVQLLGYDLPRKTWRPGEDLPLRFYWLAQGKSSENYKVFIHLIKPDDSAGVAQSDSFPILGYGATSRWEPGEVIVDDQRLHLDESVPPGTYLLVIGMYQPDPIRNLTVQQAPQVLPGDRVVLTPITVLAK